MDRTMEYDDELCKVYMSVFMSKMQLAAAYFDLDTCVLYSMCDIPETNGLRMLKQLLLQVAPNVVITSSKQQEPLLQFLKQIEGNQTEGDANMHCVKQLEILPTYELCKRKIFSINGLPNLPNESTDEERAIFFSSILDFDNTSMVSATGALLKYLDQTRPGLELEEPGVQVPILLLKSFSLKDVMNMDVFTYSALQIFQKESHPSVYKSGTAGKEGLSLFGIMNHTKSARGSSLLKTWFLQPVTNKDTLIQRLDGISFFLSARNMEVMMTLQDTLKNMKNVMAILSKMKSTCVSISDMRNLYKTIFNAICLGDVCKGLPQDLTVIHNISQAFSCDLLHIANLIKQIVDFEESSCASHFVVKEGIDSELDEKKRTFDSIPHLMTVVAQEELSKLNSSVHECSVTYLPQLGYLLNIPLTDVMKETGDYGIDPNLEFRFVAEDFVYYKSEGTTELDQKIGDLQCDIRDHEMEVLHRLQDVILERADVIHEIVEKSAELDCILALTSAARELELTRPNILEKSENVVKIIGGRHPLQALCVTQFVKNNASICEADGMMKILTGPNASGKSVYIKQVALIVYLSHIGSFVPADHADISIKDALFTRIHTNESISTPLSTFVIDLNQVSNAVMNATKYSFVVIDEFGKGTNAVDGLALLYATLRYWKEKRTDCPCVLVSTHFHQLKNLLDESDEVLYQTMEIIKTDEGVVFLYQLKDGHSGLSYASRTAEAACIPRHIIERATQISESMKSRQYITKPHCDSHNDEMFRFEKIVNEFLNKNFDADDMEGFLKGISSPANSI